MIKDLLKGKFYKYRWSSRLLETAGGKLLHFTYYIGICFFHYDRTFASRTAGGSAWVSRI